MNCTSFDCESGAATHAAVIGEITPLIIVTSRGSDEEHYDTSNKCGPLDSLNNVLS